MWNIAYIFLPLVHLVYSNVILNTIWNNIQEGNINDLDNYMSIIAPIIENIDIKRYINSDVETMNTPQLIEHFSGYRTEEHTINSNGYILKTFRIKGNGPSVFLMHGLYASSDCWIGLGSNSLPIYLASLGYDVWLGNTRGNTYSRQHTTFSTLDPEFWNFSWHEIGTEDISANIDYICDHVSVSKIMYIGFSQGTTAIYVLLSEKPEYNKKMFGVVSLGSITYMFNTKSPTLQRAINDLKFESDFQGRNKQYPHPVLYTLFTICASSAILKTFCLSIFYSYIGYDYEQIDFNMSGSQLTHILGGGSGNQFIHYIQNFRSGLFQKYDYGVEENLGKYGTASAPSYDVGKITTNMTIFVGKNDWMADIEDVKYFTSKLITKPEIIEVCWPKFNHMDPIWAKDAKTLLYTQIADTLLKYNC